MSASRFDELAREVDKLTLQILRTRAKLLRQGDDGVLKLLTKRLDAIHDMLKEAKVQAGSDKEGNDEITMIVNTLNAKLTDMVAPPSDIMVAQSSDTSDTSDIREKIKASLTSYSRNNANSVIKLATTASITRPREIHQPPSPTVSNEGQSRSPSPSVLSRQSSSSISVSSRPGTPKVEEDKISSSVKMDLEDLKTNIVNLSKMVEKYLPMVEKGSNKKAAFREDLQLIKKNLDSLKTKAPLELDPVHSHSIIRAGVSKFESFLKATEVMDASGNVDANSIDKKKNGKSRSEDTQNIINHLMKSGVSKKGEKFEKDWSALIVLMREQQFLNDKFKQELPETRDRRITLRDSQASQSTSLSSTRDISASISKKTPAAATASRLASSQPDGNVPGAGLFDASAKKAKDSEVSKTPPPPPPKPTGFQPK